MRSWITPCNIEEFDIIGAMKVFDVLDWKQSTNVEVGETVYIYTGSPISAIVCKCTVLKTNMEEKEIDDSEFVIDDSNYGKSKRYMKLRVDRPFNEDFLVYKDLVNNGLKNVQGPATLSEELESYINKKIENDVNIIEKDIDKKIVENQKKRDQEYPRKHIRESKIDTSTWQKLLTNEKIFRDSDIDFLKRIYKKDNHASTCKALSIEDGVLPQSYNLPVVNLVKRVLEEVDLSPNVRSNGEKEFWSILFWGQYTEENCFEWKIRPELVDAMENVFPNILKSYNEEDEAIEDELLVDDIAKAKINVNDDFEYDRNKIARDKPTYQNGRKSYPRDRQKGLNALAHAGHKCEINPEHKSFERKKANINYMEPHHLVPLSRSGEFEVSLDREQNIVSLCSNCHNQIHYGKGAEKLVEQLYEQRKELLEEIGIEVSLEELLKMYK